jgi:hypothetical protein
LTWTNTALNASGIRINRKTGVSGTYALLATVGANATSYSDATVAPGATYCYQLQAFSPGELSAPSTEACATTMGQLPSSPMTRGSTATTSSDHTEGLASSLLPTTSMSNAVPQLGIAKIGVFRPSTGAWYFDLNDNGVWDNCQVDGCLGPFGQQGSLPLIGDWTGTDTGQLGVFDASASLWKLDRNGNDLWDGCAADFCSNSFGKPGDLPIIGHWAMNSDRDTIGFFRPSQGLWRLDLNGNGLWDGCQSDGCLGPFGVSGDLPVVGDWNGTGTTKLGVFDPHTGLWRLDLNGNGLWDGCQSDGCLGPFGQVGDIPIAGSW